MKKSNLLLVSALVMCIASVSYADMCGIVKTAAGQTAARLIDAQVAQSKQKVATLFDDHSNETYEVTDALVSSKDGAALSDGKYFELKVKLPDGRIKSIDIGHTYLVIDNGNYMVSLNHLTACSSFSTDLGNVVNLNKKEQSK